MLSMSRDTCPEAENKPRVPVYSVSEIIILKEIIRMKNRKSLVFKISVLVLIAVMALTLVSCKKESENQSGTEITITVAITGSSGETVEHKFTTTATNLADALLEQKLVEGSNDAYGLYITSAGGEVADYDKDGAYWAISENGVDSMSGASGITLTDGGYYGLTYTVWQ